MFADDSVIDYIRPYIVKQLKTLSVKYTLKKTDYKSQTDQLEVSRPFKASLESVKKEYVALSSGVKVKVPVFLIDSVNYIERDVLVEGLFRKNGSANQKRDLKTLLDKGCRLDPSAEYSVISVADMLKLFFRELPEPLIPYKFHSVFLKCLSLKTKQKEAIMLCCFLLPSANLNALAYLMQFLLKVSRNVKKNRMSIVNLAIIFAPNIMPVKSNCTLAVEASEKLNRHVQIVQILIENADSIGVVPDSVSDHFELTSMSESEAETHTDKRRIKKRRNSLTRVLSALKRMMNRPQAQDPEERKFTPFRHLMTPKIITTCKKDNLSGFSAKKRSEILRILPNSAVLVDPQTPVKFSSKTLLTPRTMVASYSPKPEQRKSRSRPRRAVSFRGELREGSPPSPTSDVEFIQVPKLEFEAIKERVSLLESRLNDEFVQGSSSVEKAFTETMRETDKIADSTHFNCKIRRMRSDRVMRSPSARKIGRMRRGTSMGAADLKTLSETRASLNELCEQFASKALKDTTNSRIHEKTPPINSMSDLSSDDSKEVIEWQNAGAFLAQRPSETVQDRPRDSVQFILNQNAGSVLAKAKLFDQMTIPRNRELSTTSKILQEENIIRKTLSSNNEVSNVPRPSARIRRGSALSHTKGANHLKRAKRNPSTSRHPPIGRYPKRQDIKIPLVSSTTPRRSPRFIRTS